MTSIVIAFIVGMLVGALCMGLASAANRVDDREG